MGIGRARNQSIKLIPFPLARRHDLVLRLARQMAARLPDDAEQHLQQQLQRQATVLRRKGIQNATVVAQVRSFELAVRTELWRFVLVPPQPNDVA